MSKEKLATRLVQAGRHNAFGHGAVNPVVQRASSLIFDSLAHKRTATAGRAEGALFYGRRGTETHFALQQALTELEGGAGCVLYPCGAAAISNAILAFIGNGDHLLMTGAAYEPTQGFCDQVLTKLGVQTDYYDPRVGGNIAQQVKSNTKVVFLESPSSITMEIQDVPAIVDAIREAAPDAVIIMDNTWSGGILFKPLQHGVDITIQSGTKYLIGHSDYMLGTAVANERCWAALREHSYLMGQMVDADTAYMASRGLRTLAVRLAQQGKNALQVANWLSQQSQVATVNHPALPQCPGHEIFLRDFHGASGLFSFVLKQRLSDRQLAHYLDHFRHFAMAYSWGGYESLILANQPEELNAIRPAGPVAFEGTLVRLHIGLEDVSDLIADLADGFARIGAS
ncbi:cystathionine beta-lyase [Ferrimonas gelatinilytica]|uniref:Cystathionine beta-lyase n=1 Tax=Ferrimonas gelatinilytica TaxID=1255257 RepID=A0ABP9RV18_9GAMM